MTEPHDLTLEIVREIRKDVAGIRAENTAMKAEFGDLAQRIKRIERYMTHVVGMHAMNEGDVDDLRRRVETLEERIGPPSAE